MNPEIHLEILSLHFPDDALLDKLGAYLQTEVGLRNVITQVNLSLKTAYHPRRDQYNATDIRQRATATRKDSRHKLLVVTPYDLFIPVLTFVFGEAHLGGRGAVVSTCRLQETFYGLPADENLLFERLSKEAVHEIGHLYGLRHCYVPQCVMGSSTHISGVDQKNGGFCMACLQIFAEQRDASLS